MRNIPTTLIAAAVALVSSAAFAQQKMDDMKGVDMAKKPVAATSAATVHMATGMVKTVDAKSGLVTLAHEPVKSMNWPAMTMGFQVQNKLAVGKKVDSEFVQGTKGCVVTAVK